MTLRERLDLPTPPRTAEVAPPPPPRKPEWVLRQEERLAAAQGRRVAEKELTGGG